MRMLELIDTPDMRRGDVARYTVRGLVMHVRYQLSLGRFVYCHFAKPAWSTWTPDYDDLDAVGEIFACWTGAFGHPIIYSE